MNRIDELFASCKAKKKTAFIAYITAGDPTLAVTKKLIHSLASRGVDLVELGVPFSDPMADGPTIQEAFTRALKHHVSLSSALRCVKELRQEGCQVPIIIFTYFNPVIAYGIRKFVGALASSDVDGALVLDCPPEEAKEYVRHMRKQDLKTVFLIAPTSSDERIKLATSCSSGFVYCVARTGVTGPKSEVSPEVEDLVRRIKSFTDLPVAVGFGIRSHAQFAKVGKFADGVVVGSAIVSKIQESAGSRDLVEKVTRYVERLKG